MSSRHGRNKRRKMQEQIRALEHALFHERSANAYYRRTIETLEGRVNNLRGEQDRFWAGLEAEIDAQPQDRRRRAIRAAIDARRRAHSSPAYTRDL